MKAIILAINQFIIVVYGLAYLSFEALPDNWVFEHWWGFPTLLLFGSVFVASGSILGITCEENLR